MSTSKIVEMNGRKEHAPRAPAVSAKLEAAQVTLQALEGEVGQAALEAAENAPGAAKRLAGLRSQIADAERDVDELNKAHELALRLDRISRAQGTSAVRASQLVAMKSYASERETAVLDICEAAKAMAVAYRKYGQTTLKFLGVKPIGTAVPAMGMGENNIFGSAIGNLDLLISAELLRQSAEGATEHERYVLPLVKPTSRDARLIPPAIEVFREAQAAMLASIEGQVQNLDAAELARATEEAA